jgi:murein DD-endopeptidase MepM/ murein hydrolase activator NlpD
MSSISPLPIFQPETPAEEIQSGRESALEGSGGAFWDLLQGMFMSGMSSADLEGSSSLSSLFMPDLFTLFLGLLQPEEENPVPGSWNNFPSVTATNYGYDLAGVSGREHYYRGPQNTPWGYPVQGPISQGVRNGHVALDFSIVEGTPVHATLDGMVKTVGKDPDGYGKYVVVENGPYEVYFAHLSSIPVRVGDRISAGQLLGLSGNTGNSTGPHLHYEIRRSGHPLDPRKFLGPDLT